MNRLFESELFGHRKGAFTNASEDRIGRILAANGGTLFLDEIGNLPLNLQAKLLSVLEQRQVTAVGSNQPQSFDVRIITATNLPPARLRDPDHFRPDLLFRLNTVEIEMPPLRDRKSDIMPIARHYLELFSRKYGGKKRSFTAAAEKPSSNMPGPVTCERSATRSNARSFSPRVKQSSRMTCSSTMRVSLREPARESIPTILNLDQLEKETILKALRKHGFNISRACQ